MYSSEGLSGGGGLRKSASLIYCNTRKREKVAPPSGESRSPSRTTHPPLVVSLSPSVTTPFCQNDVPTKPVGGHWYRALPFVAFVTTSSPPTFRPSLESPRAFSDLRGVGRKALESRGILRERREELSFCVEHTSFTSVWRWMDRSIGLLSRSVSLEAPEVITTSHSYRRSCVKLVRLRPQKQAEFTVYISTGSTNNMAYRANVNLQTPEFSMANLYLTQYRYP